MILNMDERLARLDAEIDALSKFTDRHPYPSGLNKLMSLYRERDALTSRPRNTLAPTANAALSAAYAEDGTDQEAISNTARTTGQTEKASSDEPG